MPCNPRHQEILILWYLFLARECRIKTANQDYSKQSSAGYTLKSFGLFWPSKIATVHRYIDFSLLKHWL